MNAETLVYVIPVLGLAGPGCEITVEFPEEA